MHPRQFTLIIGLLSSFAAAASGEVTYQDLDLKPQFGDHDACMLILDVKRDTLYRYRPQRCEERLAPCSTFKIPNALIGLHTGVLSGPEHLRKWDGVERWSKTWNRDHTLRTAVRDSAFWYFQLTAAEIGQDRMRQALRALHYGNQDISGGLTQFWLDSSLKISATEQIGLLRRLAERRLPFDRKAQATVAELLVQPQYGGPGRLHAKTGSGGTPEGDATVGWYVGWIEHEEALYIFAANAKVSAAGDLSGRDIRDILLKFFPEWVSSRATAR